MTARVLIIATLCALATRAESQTQDTITSRTWLAVGLGGALGRYGRFYEGPDRLNVPHTYYVGAASVSLRKESRPGVGRHTDLAVFYGTPQKHVLGRDLGDCHHSQTVSGYLMTQTFEGKHAGFTFGLAGGNFDARPMDFFVWECPDATSSSWARNLKPSYPALGLRLGSLTGLFIETGVFVPNLAPLPSSLFTFGVGLGNDTSALQWRAGFSDAGPYVGLSFATGSNYDVALRGIKGDDNRGVSANVSRRFGDRLSTNIRDLVTITHQHPFMDRMNFFMFRGAILGGLGGPVVGLSQPQTDANRPPRLMENIIIGASAGIVAGALVGTVSRLSAPPPKDQPGTPFAVKTHDLMRYVGFGSRLGFATGVMAAFAERHVRARGTDAHQMEQVLGGWAVGTLSGAALYFLQH